MSSTVLPGISVSGAAETAVCGALAPLRSALTLSLFDQHVVVKGLSVIARDR